MQKTWNHNKRDIMKITAAGNAKLKPEDKAYVEQYVRKAININKKIF
jgi:hypothetical protein